MKSKFKHCILYFYLFNDPKHLNLTNMFKKKEEEKEQTLHSIVAFYPSCSQVLLSLHNAVCVSVC